LLYGTVDYILVDCILLASPLTIYHSIGLSFQS